MKDEILSFNNVTFSYTPDEETVRNAVEDVTFSINKGEWIAIVSITAQASRRWQSL